MPVWIGSVIWWSVVCSVVAGCLPTPNANRGQWDSVWWYHDNRGVDAKTDKPRIDGKNNQR